MSPHSIPANGSDVNKKAPSSSSPDTSAAVFHSFFLAHPAVRFVRFQWQDLSGVLRGRVLPRPQAADVAQHKRPLSIGPVAFHLALGNAFLPGIDGCGRHELIPDWTSLRTRPGLDPGYATVMCAVTEHLPARPAAPSWHLCPRRALEHMVTRVQDTLDVNLLVGFEVEFEIMKAADDGTFVPWAKSLGAFAVAGYRDPAFAYVEEVVDVLLSAGVQVDTIQPEGIRGQYEITLPPLAPMQAVDQLVLVQDTIKHVFARHGLVATMAPRPVAGSEQSIGQHTHISLNPPQRASSFLAGILQRLPTLLAFCMPYELSYERIRPFCAGKVVAWGTEDRAVPVRAIKPGHWELRFVDASANMYLALTAVLAAGLAGCERDEPLTWMDTSLDEHLPSEGTLLPAAMDEAMREMEGQVAEWEKVMESRVVHHYLRVKKFEMAHLRESKIEEVRKLMVEIF